MIALKNTFDSIAIELLAAEMALMRAKSILESKQKDRDHVMKKFVNAGVDLKNAVTPP